VTGTVLIIPKLPVIVGEVAVWLSSVAGPVCPSTLYALTFIALLVVVTLRLFVGAEVVTV
jgi:hypothetical protein